MKKDPTTEALATIARERDQARDASRQFAAAYDRKVEENHQLKARVAALEAQIAIGSPTDRLGRAIDPAHFEVYRDAAVLLSTYMAGARSGHRSDEDKKRLEQLWGRLVDKIDECLDDERTVH